jgi:hypothetical protein
VTHAEYLQQVIAEIAEELPGFNTLGAATQSSLRELAEQYFQDEFVPRLEATVNVPRYEEAMYERTESDRAFIEENRGILRTNIVKAQRAAHKHLLEAYAEVSRSGSAADERR